MVKTLEMLLSKYRSLEQRVLGPDCTYHKNGNGKPLCLRAVHFRGPLRLWPNFVFFSSSSSSEQLLALPKWDFVFLSVCLPIRSGSYFLMGIIEMPLGVSPYTTPTCRSWCWNTFKLSLWSQQTNHCFPLFCSSKGRSEYRITSLSPERRMDFAEKGERDVPFLSTPNFHSDLPSFSHSAQQDGSAEAQLSRPSSLR